MKIHIPLLFCIALFTLLFSTVSFAGGNSGQRVITGVTLFGNGAFSYIGQTQWEDPDDCDGDASFTTHWIVIRPESLNETYSEQFALTVASFLQGKKVSGFLDGCYKTSDGKILPVMRNMQVHN